MGHNEQRLIAELATLNDAEQASLITCVQRLKAERGDAAEHVHLRDALAAELATFRVPLGGYKFDRAEANAR